MNTTLNAAIKEHAKASENVGYWLHHGHRGDGNLEKAIDRQNKAAGKLRRVARELAAKEAAA